jgi:hypothetical protein
MFRNSRGGLFVLFVLFVTAGTSCSNKSDLRSAGALQWESIEANLVARPGELELSTEFSFVNQSNKTVTIDSVESDCECTLPELEEKNYAPQAKGKVKVRIRVGKNQGKEEKHVKVKVRGSVTPVVLTLNFEIPTVFRIEPGTLSWTAGKDPDTKTIEIEVISALPISIRSARSTNSSFAVKMETVREGKFYKLQIRPNESASPKSSQIQIETSYTYAPWNNFTLPLVVK